MEAIGLALPYNGSALAKTKEREDLARSAAAQVMTLIERDIKPRDIVTAEAIDDAFALDMAMGGSSNTVLRVQGSLPTRSRCMAVQVRLLP